MRVRRLHKKPAELEVTAFINLIVVLVPFLLSTAVFTRLSVIDLTLPAQSNPAVEQLKTNDLQLEVVIHPDALEVGDRLGGQIDRIDSRGGRPDTVALSALFVRIKARFPEVTEATVLAEPDTPYDTLVQVMDAVRAGPMSAGPKGTRAELFPDVSIGDAPQRKKP